MPTAGINKNKSPNVTASAAMTPIARSSSSTLNNVSIPAPTRMNSVALQAVDGQHCISVSFSNFSDQPLYPLDVDFAGSEIACRQDPKNTLAFYTFSHFD
jgi:hypothetical protein